jgi:hypothetical protein
MRIKAFFIVLCGLLFAANIALAEETDYWFEDENEEAIFYLTLPNGWKGEWQEEEGVSILHALPNDESIYLSVWALHDVKDLQSAAEALDNLLANLVTDLKPEEWEEDTINGIPFIYSDATAKAKDDGELVEVSVAFFVPAEGQVFILSYFGTPDAWHNHKQAVTSIYNSIRLEE